MSLLAASMDSENIKDGLEFDATCSSVGSSSKDMEFTIRHLAWYNRCVCMLHG